MIAPAMVRPAKANPSTATAAMVSGMAIARSRTVGAQRRQVRRSSIRRPVPNRAAITAISLVSSHSLGLMRGSNASGMFGRSQNASAPNRMRRPEAAGSRDETKRGSQ